MKLEVNIWTTAVNYNMCMSFVSFNRLLLKISYHNLALGENCIQNRFPKHYAEALTVRLLNYTLCSSVYNRTSETTNMAGPQKNPCNVITPLSTHVDSKCVKLSNLCKII